MTAVATTRRELDHRLVDGLSVRLLWTPRPTARSSPSRTPAAARPSSSASAPASGAPDVFHHPYAFAAQRGSARQDPLLAQSPRQVAAGA